MESHFHPIVAQWFGDELGPPTPAQRLGWASIAEGQQHAHRGADRVGQDPRGLSHRHRRAVPRGPRATLADEVRVLYVSPLKALSTDIHRNLERAAARHPRSGRRPRPGRRRDITAAVRTGDTPAAARAAMVKTPPHILVTTPESLYLLLTSERSRQMLPHRPHRDRRRDPRGASAPAAARIWRCRSSGWSAWPAAPLLRIGLSATQKPIEDVARWLVGHRRHRRARSSTRGTAGRWISASRFRARSSTP